jgi:hypothetical protein
LKKQRANTLQERFGFADDDLKKPAHDEILFWLEEHSLDIAKEIVAWANAWPTSVVDQKVKAVTDLVNNRADWLRDSITRHDKAGSQPLKESRFFSKEVLQKEREQKNAECERYRNELALIDRFQSLGELPAREMRVKTIWEQTLTHPATKYPIGFLDMVFVVETTDLDVDGVYLPVGPFPARSDPIRRLPTWKANWCETREPQFAFEAKTVIGSLGELIRQLRLYQQYCRHQLYVVSPDDGYAEQLVEQGFGFIKYPDKIIRRPVVTRR